MKSPLEIAIVHLHRLYPSSASLLGLNTECRGIQEEWVNMYTVKGEFGNVIRIIEQRFVLLRDEKSIGYNG